MKRTNLLVVLMLYFVSINAQETPSNIHLSQDFSGSFQTDGWTIENYSTKWTAVNSYNAGGIAPELRFEYTSGTSTTRFISPSLDISGVTDLSLSFKQLVDHFGSGYSIGVATRSDQGSWNTVWTTSPTNDIGPEIKDIIIANDDVGSSDFQFCFFLSGNAYQIDYWYIDDVSLFTPYDLDLSVNSINLDNYISSGIVTPEATLKNEGLNDITSFDIKYQISSGDIISESFTDVTILRGETYLHTFDQSWNATSGNYDLKVFISNINSESSDDNDTNDELIKTISVASQAVDNMPLFESFTSSTCPPCFTFNTTTFTPFLNSHNDEFAIIKYQMNWPGNGDPYYTAEGGVRRTFYGVSGVPALYTGGDVTPTSSSGLNDAFSAQTAKDAFFTIDASASYTETTVSANINVSPYITVEGFKLHAAIVEKETTENVSSNGETSFKNVMMKMLPNGNGTSPSFVDNEPYSVSFSQNMSATNVEEMSDLMLVVFIQDPVTKVIFQSKMVDVTLNSSVDIEKSFSFNAFPNPNNGSFTIELPTEAGGASVEVFSTTGSLVYSKNFNNSNEAITMNINQTQGVYIVKVTLQNGKTSIGKLIVK
jgi:hypothetical protein